MDQMAEKIREKEAPASLDERASAGPPEADATAGAVEPAEIKACVGATGGGEGSAIPPDELERLHSDLVAALKTVFDPEIPVDIYELGLIYRLEVDDDRNIEVDMTLTAPGCPVAGEMPGWVENAISAVPGVGQVKVKLVFDPPWDMSRMTDEARLALNMF
jgi:FeS assembly SUF system protein